MQRKVSRFWTTPAAKRTHAKEWAERVEQQRRDHWGGKTPAELISERAWRKLPKERRDAIEAAAYQRGA